jgi:hypothetical protein
MTVEGDVTLNPVRARLVTRAARWLWSSVRAHLAGVDEAVVGVAPVLDFAAPSTAAPRCAFR